MVGEWSLAVHSYYIRGLPLHTSLSLCRELTLCARRRARRIPIVRIALIALTSNTATIALMFVRGSPRSLTDRGTVARCSSCCCCSARCCRCPSSARRETARSRLSRRGRPSPVLSLPRDVVGVACRRGVVFMFMFVHESPRPVVGSRDCRSQLLPLLLLLLPSRGGSHIGIVAQRAGALAGVILFSWRVTDLRWAWAARRCETRAQPSSHGVGAAFSPVCPLIRRPSLCVQASRERSSRDRSRSASRSRDA